MTEDTRILLGRRGSRLTLIMILILFSCTPPGIHSQTQRVSVVYNISNAQETLDSTSLLSSQIRNLSSVAYLTALTPSTVVVDSCPAGAYSPDDSQTCTLCPAGKYSTFVTATSVDTCVACESGKYSSTVGANSSTVCLSCPNSTYFAGTAGPSLGACVACPANSYSYMGAKLRQACICSPGYEGQNGGPCSLCNGPVIPVSSGGGGGGMDFMDDGGFGVIIPDTFWCLYGQANPCPPNSNASAGSSRLSDCLCKPGYYGDTTMAEISYPTLCQVRARDTLRGRHGFIRIKQTARHPCIEGRHRHYFLPAVPPKTPLAYHSRISTTLTTRRVFSFGRETDMRDSRKWSVFCSLPLTSSMAMDLRA